MRVPGETPPAVERAVTSGTSLGRWKPAAAARTHLLAAGLLWTGVGAGLLAAGLRWCAGVGGGAAWGLAAAGVAAGLLKGRLALDRTARNAAARIRSRGDGNCLGGFLSWKTWLFVLVMMGLGAVLRRSGLSRVVLGPVYTAVGTALLWGSRIYWAERARSA